jgi:hypothetical protein
MEPPEDSLPEGLSWPRFTSLYARARRGAGKAEVSSAWERYKRRVGRTSPRRSVKRSAERRTSSSRRASPVRTLTAESAATLGNLPPEILAKIASQSRGSAAVMARLNRHTNAVASKVVKGHCEDDISVAEIRAYIIRALEKLKKQRYKDTDAPDSQSRSFFVYTVIGQATASLHAYRIRERRGTRLHLEAALMRARVPIGDGNVRLNFTTTTSTSLAAKPASLADSIVGELKDEAGTLLLTQVEVTDILRARRGCNQKNLAEAYTARRFRAILAALHNPVLDAHFLSEDRLSEPQMLAVARAVLTEGDPDLARRTFMTVILLSHAVSGLSIGPYTFETAVDSRVYAVRHALYRLMDVLGIEMDLPDDEDEDQEE